MFSDPQTVTVNAVAESLPRIAAGDRQASYRTADGEFTLSVSHQENQRNRRAVRLSHIATTPDPFIDGTNRQNNQSVTLVIDSPKVGFTNDQIIDLVLGLTGFLTEANVTKVVNGES